jgi:hypothetical protein
MMSRVAIFLKFFSPSNNNNVSHLLQFRFWRRGETYQTILLRLHYYLPLLGHGSASETLLSSHYSLVLGHGSVGETLLYD